MKLRVSRDNIVCLSLALYISMSLMGNVLHLIGFVIFFLASFSRAFDRRLMIRFNSYLTVHLLFALCVVISFSWVDTVKLEFITTLAICAALFEILYFILWFYRYMESGGKISVILNVFILSSFFAIIRAVSMTPVTRWMNIRNLFLGDIGLDSHNTLGMFSAICGGFSFVFAINNNGKKRLIYFGICIIEMAAVVLSGSRKGILAFAMILGAFYVLNSHSVRLVRNSAIVLGIIIIGYFLLINNETLYELAGRKLQVFIQNIFVSKDVNDSSIVERTYYREQAMGLFMKHPVLGVGINGFRAYMDKIGYSHVTYSHCNYTELLANYGLIGFSLYYIIRAKAILNSISKIGKSNSLFVEIWVCSLALIILEYGFVSYYSVWVQILWAIFYFVISRPRRENQCI